MRYALGDPRLDDAINAAADEIEQSWPPITTDQLARLAPLMNAPSVRPAPAVPTPVRRAA